MDHFTRNSTYYDRNADKYEASSWYFFNKYKTEKVIEELGCLLGKISNGENIRVLEIGPGTGYLLKSLQAVAKRTICYVGIEHSMAMGEILKKRYARLCKTFELHCLSASRQSLDEVLGAQKYDIVMGSSILHHIPDYADLIDAAAGRVAVGGVLYFVREPLHVNECSPPNILKSCLYAFLDLVSAFLLRSGLQKRLYQDKVKAESAADIGIHMFEAGIAFEPFLKLTHKGFSILLLRKYNRRVTTFLSKLENVWFAGLRKDHFGNTLFAIILRRERN